MALDVQHAVNCLPRRDRGQLPQQWSCNGSRCGDTVRRKHSADLEQLARLRCCFVLLVLLVALATVDGLGQRCGGPGCPDGASRSYGLTGRLDSTRSPLFGIGLLATGLVVDDAMSSAKTWSAGWSRRNRRCGARNCHAELGGAVDSATPWCCVVFLPVLAIPAGRAGFTTLAITIAPMILFVHPQQPLTYHSRGCSAARAWLEGNPMAEPAAAGPQRWLRPACATGSRRLERQLSAPPAWCCSDYSAAGWRAGGALASCNASSPKKDDRPGARRPWAPGGCLSCAAPSGG